MWNTIIGHGPQIEQLKKALRHGRLPSAYLFTGRKGVGKRMTADIFATAGVCLEAEKAGPVACGVCLQCRKVFSQAHPDIFIVEPESQQKFENETAPMDGKDKKQKSDNLKIEQIRELQAKLQYHPLEAKLKIAIIDECDRMTDAGANSLLKILEEPPPATHFILISALPHMLLPTIRSRCQTIAFQPIADDLIARAVNEKNGVPKEEAMRLARLSGGSLGSALSMDSGFIGDVMKRFISLQSGGDTADVMDTAEKWSHGDISNVRLVFDVLAGFYRDVLCWLATGSADVLINDGVQNIAERIGRRRAESAIAGIQTARRLADTTVNKQLMFEDILFSLTR